MNGQYDFSHFLPIANGFLPTRGSFMLDFIFVAIFAIAIVLTWSIYLVRVRRQFRRHKRIQIITTLALLVTLVAFEVDIRFFTDWRELARNSSLYESGWVLTVLWIHLCFAVPTPIVWVATVIMALRNFPKDPAPSDYSSKHLFWGRLSAILMYITAVTGCTFYVVAFVV